MGRPNRRGPVLRAACAVAYEQTAAATGTYRDRSRSYADLPVAGPSGVG
jgi:hypothetical protein